MLNTSPTKANLVLCSENGLCREFERRKEGQKTLERREHISQIFSVSVIGEQHGIRIKKSANVHATNTNDAAVLPHTLLHFPRQLRAF